MFHWLRSWLQNSKPKAADTEARLPSDLPGIFGDPSMTREKMRTIHEFLDRFGSGNGIAVISDHRAERFFKIESSEIDALEYAELWQRINS